MGAALEAAELFFQYYRESANYLERTYDFVERTGIEKVRRETVYAQPEVRQALLDRFEVVSQGSDAGPTGNSQLYVFDTKERKLVLVSGGVATVIARGAMLWWSTGDNETAEWHALDLRTLR